MKLVIFIIFWFLGIVVAFVCNENIHHWRDFVNQKTCLVLTSIFCILMSWALVIILFIDGEFELPKRLFHSCRSCSKMHYVEEYLDEDGNEVGPEDRWKVHHTYRVYTCSKCGKVEKEQLQ